MSQEDSNIPVWHCGICNLPCVDPESLLDRHFSAIRNYIFKDDGDGTKWVLCYDCGTWISTKTGISKSMLGHHFDEKKTTRKGRGHIAGGRWQSKVLSKGERDFLTILTTETCVISKQDQCLTCFLDLILPLIVIEMEQELATVVYQFCERGFPFTGKRLKKLAYEFAVASKRKGFSPKKMMAGRCWLKGFLERFPNLKKKMPKTFPSTGLNVPMKY